MNHPSPEMASPGGEDWDDSMPHTNPTPMAAAAAGAVGPGALGAAETAAPEDGLTADDLAILSRLVRRVGVDAIGRFLEAHRATP